MPASAEAVIFDLDGTLVDSRSGIVSALDDAVHEVLGPGVEPDTLDWQLGPALDEMVASTLPDLAAERRDEIAAAFRRRYDAEGWRRTSVYLGLPVALERLQARGLELYVVTNKRAVPTNAILGLPGLAGRFIEAVSLDSAVPPHADKADALRRLLRRRSIAAQRAFYVGDTEEDARAASAVGLRFVWVTWGYGDVPRRRSADNIVVRTVGQLVEMVDPVSEC